MGFVLCFARLHGQNNMTLLMPIKCSTSCHIIWY
jgi:hypothetical protein